MKKILAIIALCFVCAAAHADDRSRALLDKMGGQIASWKQYTVEFSLQPDPSSPVITGACSVSGQRYKMSVAGREVYGDGATRWEVNPTDREVIVDRADPADQGVLANPTAIFSFPDALFTHSYTGETKVAGRKCEVVQIRPRDGKTPVGSVTLSIDSQSGLPVALSYRLSGVSATVEVKIVKIAPLTALPAGGLRFDRNSYKGYEVVDFR